MTTATTTLTDFLLARIGEDEAGAQAASPGPWHVNAESDTVLAVDDIEVCDGFALSGPQTRATTQHIARHDPARALAECEAKRRIVERAQRASQAFDQSINPTTSGVAMTMDLVLADLALSYADHPDYDEAWRP